MKDLFSEVENTHALDNFHFSGAVFEAKYDHTRLTGQLKRIFELMRDGHWRTLAEIRMRTNDPESSISAQLRNMRKIKQDGVPVYYVEKRIRGERSLGLWEYQLTVNL